MFLSRSAFKAAFQIRDPGLTGSGYLLDATRYNRLRFDQGCKREGADLDDLLSQSIGKFAARFGFAAIESKGELVHCRQCMCLDQEALNAMPV
jgi:hypothetical protein